MENNPKMGLTEDERNNLLIDCMEMIKGGCPEAINRPFQYFDGATLEVKETPLPVSVTITIKDQGLI